jgi:hypothetical protein
VSKKGIKKKRGELVKWKAKAGRQAPETNVPIAAVEQRWTGARAEEEGAKGIDEAHPAARSPSENRNSALTAPRGVSGV